MIHKKWIAGALALLFSCFSFLPVASADTVTPNDIYEPYFLLVNADDPTQALYGMERDADLKVYPASTTKILTCIIALEQGNLTDLVSVSENAVDFGRGNSLMGLQAGDAYTLEDMLYGLMLLSGNDAAVAIAEHLAGSTSAFSDMMNAKAKELGMDHSHFVTPHGKHKDDHYTTVRDMAILTSYALKNETFRKIVSTHSYTALSGPVALELLNSNRMIADVLPTEELTDPVSCLYPYCIGVKTGDTDPAGKCLIAAAEQGGVTLIAVLFGGTLNDENYDSGMSPNRKDPYNARRFQDAAKLFDYAFAQMQQTVTVADLINSGMQTEFPIDITNAAEDDPESGVLMARADLSPEQTVTLMKPVMEALQSNIAAIASPTVTVNFAPIADGSVVGIVEYAWNGEVLLSCDLIASRSVKEGMAQVDIDTSPSSDATDLIADSDHSRPNNLPIQNSSGQPNTKMIVCIILVAVIGLLLLFCIFMFFLYLRMEAKRRKKRAARQRAKQQQARYDNERYR